jgi:hypothetical protein
MWRIPEPEELPRVREGRSRPTFVGDTLLEHELFAATVSADPGDGLVVRAELGQRLASDRESAKQPARGKAHRRLERLLAVGRLPDLEVAEIRRQRPLVADDAHPATEVRDDLPLLRSHLVGPDPGIEIAVEGQEQIQFEEVETQEHLDRGFANRDVGESDIQGVGLRRQAHELHHHGGPEELFGEPPHCDSTNQVGGSLLANTAECRGIGRGASGGASSDHPSRAPAMNRARSPG